MDKDLLKSGEVLLYSDDNNKEYINVIFKDETFWLTQKAMSELFGVKTQAVSKHLSNIFDEGELDRNSTCSKMEQVEE